MGGCGGVGATDAGPYIEGVTGGAEGRYDELEAETCCRSCGFGCCEGKETGGGGA